MKKFTVIALCFVLTAALMTACRSKNPAETDSPTTATNATHNTTAPTILPTDILPDMDATGDSGIMDDATGHTGNDGQRRLPMPIH